MRLPPGGRSGEEGRSLGEGRRLASTAFALRWLGAIAAIAAVALLAPSDGPVRGPESASAGVLPSGFTETVALSGLTNPTVVRFAGDGRVFVAEKSGLIKVFDSLSDPTPSTFADLRTNVHNFWDRGMLGMALPPDFPSTPYVYVAYAYDHQLGSPSPPPRWGDTCPTPPGATSDGCVISARLSRLQAAGNVMTGSEEVLVEDWCQQYPSHSIGTVEFGPDGALYASGGDGASFNFADYGQDGSPVNPCGDPGGSSPTPPSAEGGALRSQDLLTSGDAVTLDGSIIRVDPVTGAGLPTNPLAGSADANARRIIAFGQRNPFRFRFRPGTNEIWVGDVGWNTWEEINRVSSPTDSTVENFGWPCYEGDAPQSGYDALNLTICENLYGTAGGHTTPYYAYSHSSTVVEGESCPSGTSSISGLAFAPAGTTYPASYQSALFFADYSRDCIWVMKTGGGSTPSPSNLETFVADASNPVNIEFGPGGDLFYIDFDGGTIRRIQWTPPPTGTTYLSDLNWSSMTNGWGPVEKDRSNGESGAGDGGVLTLNGSTYAKGLGAHAASDVRYAIANCSRFKASVGLDDEVGSLGSVTFEVYADATEVYDSGVMTGSTATKLVDVSIAGATQLRLVVTGGADIDYDHADWALARIECDGGGGPPPGGPPPFAPPVSLPSGTNAHSVTMADLDGDSDLDLVAANAGASTASRWLGNGDGTFGTRATFATGPTPKQVSVGDLNGDGDPDLVSANQDGASVSVLLGNGSGDFGSASNFGVCAGTHETALGHLNGDGALDVVVACWGGSVISVLIGNGNGTFAPAVNYGSGAAPHSVVLGNFDGDGFLDAAIANHGSNNVGVFRGVGNGTFQAVVTYAVGTAPHSIRAGDLNGDGRLDLVTANDGSANVSVLRGVGNGTFQAATHYATGSVPKGVAVADVTGGGRLDVLTANTAGSYPTCCQPGGDTMSVLVGNGDGTLGGPSSFTVGQTPFSVATGDLDGDGDLDVATANWHSNDVTVLENLTVDGPDTTPPTVTARTPTPGATGVALGVSPTVTFSEAMNPATLTASTFTLTKQGAGSPAVATVSYTGATATLDPSANLDPSSTYTALVKGGASGAKDVAGNPLAADVTWTFTTGTGAASETYLSDLTWTSMTNGWGPAEEDSSNGESAAGDGGPLTLNGATYAKGLGVHAASDVRYALSGCTRFRASIGLDDEVGDLGSVTFEVYAGATEVYDSGVMTGATATKLVDVSIASATQLRLVVTGGADIDYDHADWALARVECGGGGGDTTPPTVTARTPVAGATGVALGVSPTVTFSEAMNPATLTASTFTLTKQGAGSPVAATVSYTGATATLDPSANLDPSSTYTALVKGGASGAKDVAGNPLAADDSWTFTTAAAADTTPPTIVDRTPAPGATGVAIGVSPTATFSEAMNPATLTSSTFTLTKQGAGGAVAASVSYTGATATLDPSANLDPSSTYTALVKGGASGAKDVAGNPLAADVSWTFTTAATPPPTGETYLSDLTWSSMTNGWGPAEKDRANGESGTGDGAALRIDGTTYAKGLGVHAASDIRYAVSNCTSFRGTVGIDDETGGFGSVVFEVYAGATKVYDSGVMFANTPAKLVDVSIAGATQLRLVVTHGPDDPTNDHADWALARIECGGGGGDTTPPTIVDRAPAPGATGVALSVSPTATFSEAMNPATLTSSTFTLTKQGAGSPVAANVSYAGATATLDPSANLDPSSTYTALVKGGASGAKDVAGNPLAADVSWTFTTGAAGGNGAPTPVIDSPSSSLSWKVGDSISFTGHATDPEQGTLPASALTWTLLLQHCPAGCHTHTVQSWDGVAGGSFNAPDHDFPSYLELRLTATDSGGASASTTVRLDPQTVELRFESVPLGLQLAVNGTAASTPFTRTVIVGSSNSLSAPSPQTLTGTSYEFASWSDGGAQTHNIVAPVLNATWSASYTAAAPGSETYLSNLTWSSMTNGWGPAEKDQSNGESNSDDGAALTIGGTTYDKGLGVHSVSDIRYAISNCSSFRATVGIDDETGGYGSVSFEVYADSTKVFDSGVMFANAAPQVVDVSIAGASQLRLVVTNGGDDSVNDHADWALARIACG
jgi:glucose/arabinose dehydrogenase